MQLSGKLHNQYGVLGRQAYQGDKADLEENIIRHAGNRHGHDCTDQSQWHHQHDGKRY